ncbi:MAG: nucleotide exchange factor GrpE [Alphaproteobacteria bacterium]
MTGQDRPDPTPEDTAAPQQDGEPAPVEPGQAAAAYARAQGATEPAADAGAAPEGAADAEALAALAAENRDLREQMLRTLADMENLRRRTAREREDAGKFAISKFAKDLLSVADNLQRALQAIPTHGADDDDLMRTLAEGVSAVDRELAAVLERNGVSAIDALGQPFDSNLHEAVMEQPSAEHPAGHVAQVFQTGYLLNDRLLRPAMVVVAKAP